MKVTRLQIGFLVLELLGVVALFLPFTQGVSPWNFIIDNFNRQLWTTASWPFALPAFLALAVWLFSLRGLFPKPLTKVGHWSMIIFAILGWIIPLFFMFCVAFSMLHECLRDVVISARDWRMCFVSPQLLHFVVPVLLALTVFRKLPLTLAAPVVLRFGYLPNAVFSLYVFSDEFRNVEQLQVGAAFVAATVVLYVLEIVYFTRRGLKQNTAAAQGGAACVNRP